MARSRPHSHASCAAEPFVRAIFLGFRNQRELSPYFHAADLFSYLPSLWGETWGLVVNEALHHGAARGGFVGGRLRAGSDRRWPSPAPWRTGVRRKSRARAMERALEFAAGRKRAPAAGEGEPIFDARSRERNCSRMARNYWRQRHDGTGCERKHGVKLQSSYMGGFTPSIWRAR